MKKIVVCAAVLFMALSAFAAPGSKLVKKFTETFPNAENVRWSDDKDGFFVSFHQHGNFEKVFYDKDGDFVCSWKYSNGNDLPTNILLQLKHRFGESTINGVTELTQGEGSVYEIKLSTKDKWYAVQTAADGGISDVKKYKRHDAVE
jgi:hypothetical protein